MKIALVYDCANQIGGAERVLLAIKNIWPKLVFFTSLVNKQKASWFDQFADTKTSFLNQVPGKNKLNRWLIPLMPIAFEQFDFKNFDLVISVSTGPAKAVLTTLGTCHINYCLSPRRDIWEKRFLSRSRLAPFLNPIRCYDYHLAQRPDYLLATCQNVANRIEKHYRRQATIVYPGVDINRFCLPAKKQGGDSFLLVSRLVAYKKTELAIETFNQLKLPLRIVGVGPELPRLKKIAGSTIKFLGLIPDQQLIGEYQNCQALIVPQEEDFGLTPIEAQACGKPVIAYGRGGALETIITGQTGLFFADQTVTSLARTVSNFNPNQYSAQTCRQNAQKFSVANFMLLFKERVDKLLTAYQKQFRE